MTKKEHAVDLYNRGFLCSQAVLASYSNECGISEVQGLKLGSCFGSGMRQGEVCGAVSGALMVLGLLYSKYEKVEPISRESTNTVNDIFLKRFKEECGSYICNELLGADLRTPEGMAYIKEHHLFGEFCPKMVAKAVDILEEILAAVK